MIALTFAVWSLGGLAADAQLTNGIVTVVHEALLVVGGSLSGNAVSIISSVGDPAGGRVSNGIVTIVGGDEGSGGAPGSGPALFATVTVTGSINDPAATVSLSINGAAGVPATISGAQFSVANVQLPLGPNTLVATATDVAGNSASATIHIYVDLPAALKTPSFSINVAGTIDDPAASVSVNGIAAPINAGQFIASQVPLTRGLNTLTATATDVGGNVVIQSMRVFVSPGGSAPAKPTVGTVGQPIPEVTTASSLTIGGTKTAGTSIWINGQQVVALNGDTTWSTTVNLVEGDNELHIVAKNAGGTPSAETIINIIVDNLPPVITSTPPAKTNLTPFTLTGTVDDSKTVVTVNGVTASRTKRDFSASVSLAMGSNTLTIVATSPNGYVTTTTRTITRGTAPTITAIQPATGNKRFDGAAVTIQITAVDAQSDPIEYQIRLDGQVLRDWATSPTTSWTPSVAQRGVRTIEVRARDGFGGDAIGTASVLILRPPVTPP